MSDALPDSLIPTELSELEARPVSASMRAWGNRLAGRVAVVTDGARGLGRTVALAFAREGASVVISWLNEHEEAAQTIALLEAEGQPALSIPGDIGNPDFAVELVHQAVATFGRIDILVNNAAEQHECVAFEDISEAQVERVFRTNILGPFWVTKASLPHMSEGACIINTGVADAYPGSDTLVDYVASKAAVAGFTRALALHLAERGIRVSAVAPGRLVLGADELADIAANYVFLASADGRMMSGQVLTPGVAVPALEF